MKNKKKSGIIIDGTIFSKRLWLRWITYLFALKDYLKYKISISMNPETAKYRASEIAFRTKHAEKLNSFVEKFFKEAEGKTDTEIYFILRDYDREWKKHVNNINLLSRDFHLNPGGFSEKIKDNINKLLELTYVPNGHLKNIGKANASINLNQSPK